jgi:membrane protein YqaA with SNARE-associated domain
MARDLVDDEGPVTPQHVSDFEARQREAREQITLSAQPVRTLYLFFSGMAAITVYSLKYCASHPVFIYFLLPVVGLWWVLEQVPGPLTEVINQFEFCIEFVTWWVGLGVLSSVGLGSGLQSGVLFLYPHIIKVFFAAQTCKTLDFESATDIWFRKPSSLFKCPAHLTYESTPVTFWGTWLKIIPMCFLQAAGTAIGEVPPYWMTRAARLAAIEAGISSTQDIPEELESNSSYAFINRGKAWLIRFLQKHGFYGVLFMASYPNIAFDLCGICCGHFLMPFWSFLGATFIGKAIIRNGYQSLIYVTLCRCVPIIFLILSSLSAPAHLFAHLPKHTLQQQVFGDADQAAAVLGARRAQH